MEAIKSRPDTADIPVIMLSAKGKLIDKMRGKMAGSTEYLTKPFNSLQLIRKVKQHFKPDRNGS